MDSVASIGRRPWFEARARLGARKHDPRKPYRRRPDRRLNVPPAAPAPASPTIARLFDIYGSSTVGEAAA